MSPVIITLLVLLGVGLLLALWLMGIYNGLVVAGNRFKNAFAQIDVQLKRVVVPGTSLPPIIRATAWPPEASWATLNALAPPTTRPTPGAASRSSSGCHQDTGSPALAMLSASNSPYTSAIRIKIARTK